MDEYMEVQMCNSRPVPAGRRRTEPLVAVGPPHLTVGGSTAFPNRLRPPRSHGAGVVACRDRGRERRVLGGRSL